MKLVIVGGVAGGASAAARARRLSESSEIVLFERGPDPSFANCGMPYYVGGEIADRKKLLVTPVERLVQRYRLDVRTCTVVEAIDRERQVVRARDLRDGRTYEESYDRLILSPGAAPLRPPLPGIDTPGIFVMRELSDSDRIKQAVDQGARRALVVGAGFIGLELTENLVRRGVATTVVELAAQILPPWDHEMTTTAAAHLRQRGVTLLLGDAVAAFAPNPEGGIVATLKSGATLAADLVVLSVGVRPENKLAVDAGLDVGPRGGIRVNEAMQTSDPHVYAVGDAVETRDFVLGGPAQIPLAGPANRQGRIAANHVFGGGPSARYRGTQGTSILRVFDMTLAMTGASEKTLVREKRSFAKVYVHPGNHAGYYPGAEGMTLKVLFAPDTGRLLGAQACGGAGVDKRIDVLAVAVQAGLSVFDLEEMELAYSPQYGSAKDPVNMAGFVASGQLRGEHPQLTVDRLPELAPSTLIIDVRSPDEYARGHLLGAVNVPVDDLRGRLAELPADRPILAYCQVGMRGYLATRILLAAGRDVRNLSGGYQSYRQFHP